MKKEKKYILVKLFGLILLFIGIFKISIIWGLIILGIYLLVAGSLDK